MCAKLGTNNGWWNPGIRSTENMISLKSKEHWSEGQSSSTLTPELWSTEEWRTWFWSKANHSTWTVNYSYTERVSLDLLETSLDLKAARNTRVTVNCYNNNSVHTAEQAHWSNVNKNTFIKTAIHFRKVKSVFN